MQKTAYDVRSSDWSSDVCSSDLRRQRIDRRGMVAIGHLDQAKLWPEGVFAHEFGIDGDEIAVPDEVAEFDQCGVGFDQRMDLHSAPIQLVERNGQEKLPMLVGSRSQIGRAHV